MYIQFCSISDYSELKSLKYEIIILYNLVLLVNNWQDYIPSHDVMDLFTWLFPVFYVSTHE